MLDNTQAPQPQSHSVKDVPTAPDPLENEAPPTPTRKVKVGLYAALLTLVALVISSVLILGVEWVLETLSDLQATLMSAYTSVQVQLNQLVQLSESQEAAFIPHRFQTRRAELWISGLWLVFAFFLERLFEKALQHRGYTFLVFCSIATLIAILTANYLIIGSSAIAYTLGLSSLKLSRGTA